MIAKNVSIQVVVEAGDTTTTPVVEVSIDGEQFATADDTPTQLLDAADAATEQWQLALTSDEMNGDVIVVRTTTNDVVTDVQCFYTESVWTSSLATLLGFVAEAYTDTIIDSSGNPIENVRVRAYTNSNAVDGLVETVLTNSVGVFTLSLPPGTYYLRTYHPSYAETRKTVTIS